MHALQTASRLAKPAARRASRAFASRAGDVVPAPFRGAPTTRVSSRASTLFEELDKELESMSRAFFGPAFGAADPFGREALAPRAPRAAAALAAPLPHTLGAADIKITPENSLEISVDVPGVPKSALTVEVDAEDRVLTIAGSRADKLASSDEPKEAGEGGEAAPAARAVRVERAASFLRRFALPPTADLDAITSSLKDGVLHVVVPSAAEEEKKPAVKKIEVEG